MARWSERQVSSVLLPDHVRRNRTLWDEWAGKYAASGAASWARDTPVWGIWGIPEARVGMLPDDLNGKDAIELGCGTAYVSAWMARRGARVVGIDNSEAQLATARRLQQEHGLEFPLLHGNAEAVPYPDASFDFAISEYGACLWADPQRWIREAARILRPGGRLTFLVNSFLLMLCVPAGDGVAATDRPPAFRVRYVSRRVARRHRRGVPSFARRLDPSPPILRFRDRGLDRDAPRGGRGHVLPFRDARVGSTMAVRRGVEGTKARVSRADPRSSPWI